jgi:hypothetical protein
MKKVNMPITVPSGQYCREYNGKHEICEHFSNDGGHVTCSLGFYGQAEAKDGVLKDPKCDSLHDANAARDRRQNEYADLRAKLIEEMWGDQVKQCRKCGHPCIDGYCCMKCGNQEP